MYVYHTLALPFIASTDPEARRHLAGPTMTKDEINFAAATKAAQIEAGSEIIEIMKALDKKAKKVREKHAIEARDPKAVKARDQKASKARESQGSLNKRSTPSPRRLSEKFVSLPSGLTLPRSALAETKQRARTHFGVRPKSVRDKDEKKMAVRSSSTDKRAAKDRQASWNVFASKTPERTGTARRESNAPSKKTKKPVKSNNWKKMKKSKAFCLC